MFTDPPCAALFAADPTRRCNWLFQAQPRRRSWIPRPATKMRQSLSTGPVTATA